MTNIKKHIPYLFLIILVGGFAFFGIARAWESPTQAPPGGSPSISSVPAGAVSIFGGSSAPEGWLLCDGSAVSRATYANLFAAIGTTYGAGDGSTTFNVPNIKGRVVAGYDAGQAEFNLLGETGGTKTHTLTVAEMPSHDHGSTFAGAGHQHSYSGWTGTLNYPAGRDSFDETNQQEAANMGHIHPYSGWVSGPNQTASVAAQGGNGAHNNIQPYIAMQYIIKF